jgi:predicted SnoaL-like aldol condensation-catalyzing enzyme
MKQFLSIVLNIVFFLLMACNSGSDPSVVRRTEDAGKKNLLAANAINNAIETGDVSNLGDYITLEAVDHSGEHGDVKGIDNIKAVFGQRHKMAPNDMKLEVIRELADSEFVFQWLRVTGTAPATGMGAPVGSKFDLASVSVTRFKNGKATEHWEFMELAQPTTGIQTPATANPR